MALINNYTDANILAGKQASNSSAVGAQRVGSPADDLQEIAEFAGALHRIG